MMICNKYKVLFIIILVLGSIASAYSQTAWTVPQEKKSVTAPFKFDASTIKKGEQLFTKNCMSCHGMPGKGTNIKMNPLPVDPASKQYQANTDGEIFYKMTEGRGPMPSFKNIIPENDRWFIISYVRSFNKDYVQAEPLKQEKGEAEKNFRIKMSFDKNENKFKIKLVKTAVTDKSLAGFNISMFAKRYFGDLKLAESKATDENGNAVIKFQPDLPGDKDGNVNIKVVAENESGVSVAKDTIMKIGVPVVKTNLLNERAWWNVRSKAPLWIILTYSISLLTGLGFILYIIYLLFRIWKAGKSEVL